MNATLPFEYGPPDAYKKDVKATNVDACISPRVCAVLSKSVHFTTFSCEQLKYDSLTFSPSFR